MKRRYPLETLSDVQKRKKQARTQELAAQIEQRKSAEGALARAQTARQVEQASLEQTTVAEARRVQDGSARASDFQDMDRYRQGRERALTALREREQEASERVQVELGQEHRAMEAMASAERDVEIGRRHRTSWQKREDVREERREEEAALEAHTAKAQLRRSSSEP